MLYSDIQLCITFSQLDLSTLKIKNVRDSYGGAAWCMASCPRHCLLAIGCEDGATRLFRYDGGVLEYARSLPNTGARILCVAFHPTLPRLFMGCDDGCIRCFDEVSKFAVVNYRPTCEDDCLNYDTTFYDIYRTLVEVFLRW